MHFFRVNSTKHFSHSKFYSITNREPLFQSAALLLSHFKSRASRPVKSYIFTVKKGFTDKPMNPFIVITCDYFELSVETFTVPGRTKRTPIVTPIARALILFSLSRTG